jgi:hypothetical protein
MRSRRETIRATRRRWKTNMPKGRAVHRCT